MGSEIFRLYVQKHGLKPVLAGGALLLQAGSTTQLFA